MKNMLLNLYLFWGMLQDLKERKISFIYLMVGAIIGVLFLIEGFFGQCLEVIDILFSFLPGIIFLLIAKFSKEKIGFGDGWLFLILGGWIGSKKIWALWQLSLVLSATFSLLMLGIKKCRIKSQIPFIPFVWLIHLIFMGANYE